jgi:hypothetical protein
VAKPDDHNLIEKVARTGQVLTRTPHLNFRNCCNIRTVVTSPGNRNADPTKNLEEDEITPIFHVTPSLVPDGDPPPPPS